MAEYNYKPNSHKYKEEQKAKNELEKKKVEKAITGKVRIKKKSDASKLKDEMIVNDIRSVFSYAVKDVIIPAAKKTICDVVNNGINMMMYGEIKSSNTRSNSVSYVSYNNISSKRDRDDRIERRNVFTLNDFIFENRKDAEEVLNALDEIIENYDVATVNDLYDAVGASLPYTGSKYGWTTLATADIIHVREGYLLKLPKARPI